MQSATKHSRDDALPSIGSDHYLQVFTHKSLRRPIANPAEYDDNERLSVLGAKALEMAVLDALMGERPMLNDHELETRLQDTIAFETIDGWVKKYSMRTKLRCHPDYFGRLSEPEEVFTLFHAYVGAVFAEQGIDAVKQWVESLLGMEPSRKIKSLPTTSKSTYASSPDVQMAPPVAPAVVPPPPPSFLPPQLVRQPQPQQMQLPMPMSAYTQSRYNFMAPPASFQSTTMPLHNVYRPPPPPSPKVKPEAPTMPNKHTLPPPPYQANLFSSASTPMAPAQPGLAFLQLFNQTAAQRRVNVEYKAEFTGPPHAGKWTVTCVVNGIPKGTGSGGNKQIAKEVAARAAYYSMGWT